VTDDELEAARKRNALPTVKEPTDAELDRDNLLRHVDELSAERDELRAKMEVAEAGYFAAVRQARWQAATNKELNDKQKELDALRAELELSQHRHRTDVSNLHGKLTDAAAELAALREATDYKTCHHCCGTGCGKCNESGRVLRADATAAREGEK
jgi:predicted  nucleic acid-binding Zn-ribbon protein